MALGEPRPKQEGRGAGDAVSGAPASSLSHAPHSVERCPDTGAGAAHLPFAG